MSGTVPLLLTKKYAVSPCNNRYLGKCWSVVYSLVDFGSCASFKEKEIYLLIKPDSFQIHHFGNFFHQSISRVPIRIMSACLPGLLGDQECDCSKQMEYYLKTIKKKKRGVFIYLPQESKGRGLRAKIIDHRMQAGLGEKGESVKAMKFSECASILYPNENYDCRRYDYLMVLFSDLGLDKYKFDYLGSDKKRFFQIRKESGLDLKFIGNE